MTDVNGTQATPGPNGPHGSQGTDGSSGDDGLSERSSSADDELSSVDDELVDDDLPLEPADYASRETGGTLVLAGTPIGDFGDAPPRLAAELESADVIAAEDTRRLRRLTQALGVQPRGRIVSYFEANESARTPDLVNALGGGARVLLVTDAGMPSVSDPGYRLVAAAVEHGIRVTAVPGPSAVLTALALSGLPVDRFCFEGFLPRKAGERLSRLREAAGERRTLVYFEAPHRLDDSLAAMVEVFGAARRAAVCRELTKTYEEIKRGGLGELAAWAAKGVRGEITVVVEGAPAPGATDLAPEELVRRVLVREEAGERRKEAIAAVATEAGLPKRDVFDAVVAAKNAARTGSPEGKGLS
jgi:16S rRNA (cytidine1402-2'-O)-methyltransferase